MASPVSLIEYTVRAVASYLTGQGRIQKHLRGEALRGELRNFAL